MVREEYFLFPESFVTELFGIDLELALNLFILETTNIGLNNYAISIFNYN